MCSSDLREDKTSLGMRMANMDEDREGKSTSSPVVYRWRGPGVVALENGKGVHRYNLFRADMIPIINNQGDR